MRGLMQRQPLLVSSILTFAARHHGAGEVVSNAVDGGRHRYTYREAERRARRRARARGRLGVRRHDPVGTRAWNSYRHLELYYAASGMGAVCHTINPRLFDEQVAYIVDHAEDRVLFVDPAFVPLVERILPRLAHPPLAVAVTTDRAHMPEVALPSGVGLHCYEDLLAEVDEDFAWPVIDEDDACALCYTSGTTGHPKGVLYSHRSTVLHAYGVNLADAFGLRAVDRVLPVVPMFHVNAWGIPHAAPMVGASLVLPGGRLDGATLHELMTSERVTMAAGVPTVWQGLLDHLERSGTRIDGAVRLLIGGAACPPHLIEGFDRRGVRVEQGWGMTEISPVGAYNGPKPSSDGLEPEAALRRRAKQGRAFHGIDLRIVDDEGRELPWDGLTSGHLLVRGHWVCAGYFGSEGEGTHDPEGWFRTGDIGTIDPDGYLDITDRAKDLIKSGGEWISSLALEAVALAQPGVAEAAVIAARHPVWNERPLLLIVARPGHEPDPALLLAAFAGKVSKWSVPDEALIVPALPRTATGKLQKVLLRQQYGDHYLRAVAAD